MVSTEHLFELEENRDQPGQVAGFRGEPVGQIDHPRHGLGRSDGGNRQRPAYECTERATGKEPTGHRNERGRYCRGTLGRGPAQSADPARTYICLGFVDSEGKRATVSIGMAIEAATSESNENRARALVVTERSWARTISSQRARWQDVSRRMGTSSETGIVGGGWGRATSSTTATRPSDYVSDKHAQASSPTRRCRRSRTRIRCRRRSSTR